MKFIYLVLLSFVFFHGDSQEIPVHVSETNIYDFLDELANESIIDLNSVVKPYSDLYVFQCLKKANNKRDKLNTRQKKELNFYLSEFSYLDNYMLNYFDIPLISNVLDKWHLGILPPEFNYRDSLFYMSIRPIWGIQYLKNNKGLNFHRWGGAAFKMIVGNNFSAWASLRDNNVSAILSNKIYFTRDEGGNYKGRKAGGGDYSEMRGGIAYSWNWGSVSLVKDHLQWGNNYNGANIFSSKPPSIAQLKLHIKPVKWFDFNYFHGWLVSNVIDSIRSYTTSNGNRRDVMHPKYIAANMFTVTPFRKINFSFGNSIVYSDMNPHPAYLIPFLFYKPVDHWLNSTDSAGKGVGQNSQMFMDISIRRLKHFHFYGTLFIDELKLARIKEPGKYNPFGYKVGVKNSGSLLDNLYFIAEYTRTRPIVYEHYISTTTFETSGYNMGHYLRSNSDELFFVIGYKPLSRFLIKGEYTHARHGKSYQYNHGNVAITYPFMKQVLWENTSFSFLLQYEFAYNCFFKAGYQYNKAQGQDMKIFTPEFYQGENHTFNFGFNLGF